MNIFFVLLLLLVLVFYLYFYFGSVQENILDYFPYGIDDNVVLKKEKYFEPNIFFFIIIFCVIYFFYLFMVDNNLITTGKILNEIFTLNTLSIHEHISTLNKTNFSFFKKSFEILEKMETQNFLNLSDLIFKHIIKRLNNIKYILTDIQKPSIDIKNCEQNINDLYHSGIEWF